MRPIENPSRRARSDPYPGLINRPNGGTPIGSNDTVPYRWSEVIHRSGTKAGNEALERERAQIVNNFAQGASATTNNRPIR